MKINSVIFNKLLLQAEEAKDQKLYKLASGLYSALEDKEPTDNPEIYSYNELNKDIYEGFWKLAFNFIKYYDLNSLDAQKIDETIKILADNFINELELTVGTDCVIGPNELKVPGEE